LLRKDGSLWRSVVLWISGISIIVAVTGIWIGALRLCWRRFSHSAPTPYRGWMAWHHLTGLVGGLPLLTWIFSGWLSLNPGEWFGDRGLPREALARYAGHDAPDFPIDLAVLQKMARHDEVEARFVWFDGAPLIITSDRQRQIAVFSNGASTKLTDERLFAAARLLLPDAKLILQERLIAEDAYWYSHHNERALPILRVGFDDEDHTWFHIDPKTGEILDRTYESRRAYRWLFNGLHSFDFQFLIRHRPAWDIVVWSLSLFGLTISTSGIVIAWRRLQRHRRKLKHDPEKLRDFSEVRHRIYPMSHDEIIR
jgi:uncharacterized iron-regulated membrane protein